jgi:hypothetical protein
MHVDPEKKFDRRSIERKIREGFMSQKEYDDYLANLPDVSDKVHDHNEKITGEKKRDKKAKG